MEGRSRTEWEWEGTELGRNGEGKGMEAEWRRN